MRHSLKNNIILILLLILATSFSILYHGYNFGRIDQVLYIPYLKSLVDSSLYPNDILITTWKELYFANSWNVLAIAVKFIPLESLVFSLHVLFRFLFFLAVYLLSFQIFKNRYIAYMSIILWFIPKPSVGFNIFYNEFVQSEVALAFLLFSILLFLKNKYIFSFIVLGLSFHVHPPMSIFIFGGFLLYLLYKKHIKQILLLFATVFIISFPVIIPTLIFAKERTGYDAEWIELTKIRSPQHSFTISWSREIWMNFLLFLALFAASLNSLRKSLANENQTKTYFFTLFLLVVILVGFVTSEIIPIPEIIVTVPFHITSILSVLASLFIVYFIYQLVTHSLLKFRMLGYALFLIVFFSNFGLNVNPSHAVVATEFLLISFLISRVIKLTGYKKENFLYITIFIFTIIFLWMPFLIYSNINRNESRHEAWVDVQKWAKKNTEKSAIFMVPIYEAGFRVHSERSIVADWSDGTAGYLSPQFLKDWWKKMSDFGVTKRFYEKSYQKKLFAKLNEDRIKFLSDKYNASYFVSEKRSPYDFFKVYRNDYYTVYKL